MKHNKKKFTNKDFTIAIVELTNLVMDNKNHIKMLSDFFFNYLDMKGETEQYTKHMESKVDEILKDSGCASHDGLLECGSMQSFELELS